MVSFPFRGWWVLPARYRAGRLGLPEVLPVLVLGRSASGVWLVGVPAVAGACGLCVGAGSSLVAVVGYRAAGLVRWPVPGAGSCLVVVAGCSVWAAGTGSAAWWSAWSGLGAVPWAVVWPLVPASVRAGWSPSVPGAVAG